MIFEFLVACRVTPGDNLNQILVDLLFKALEDNLNEFDEEAVTHMVLLHHERNGNEFSDETGGTILYKLIGFEADLPEETVYIQTVIEDFTAALSETPPIFHVIKFEDPILQRELTQLATEIYSLEMKLRRVLSIIYLHAYQNKDPYDLLCDETVQPMAKERPQCDQMRTASENQFFHLTFGQYVGLNHRLDIKLPALLEIIKDTTDFETFRSEINRVPVMQEDDAGLLAGLKERMDAIERMRNCVAHNRCPSRSTTENYRNAFPLIDTMLDEYLKKWEI